MARDRGADHRSRGELPATCELVGSIRVDAAPGAPEFRSVFVVNLVTMRVTIEVHVAGNVLTAIGSITAHNAKEDVVSTVGQYAESAERLQVRTEPRS